MGRHRCPTTAGEARRSVPEGRGWSGRAPHVRPTPAGAHDAPPGAFRAQSMAMRIPSSVPLPRSHLPMARRAAVSGDRERTVAPRRGRSPEVRLESSEGFLRKCWGPPLPAACRRFQFRRPLPAWWKVAAILVRAPHGPTRIGRTFKQLESLAGSHGARGHSEGRRLRGRPGR